MRSTDRTRIAVLPWAALGLACAALLWLGWSWSEARQDDEELRGWQDAMLQQIEAASGRTALAPADAPAVLADIVAARDAARAMAPTTTPLPPAPTAVVPGPPPAAVGRAEAAGEIARLSRTQSTGTAAGDAQIIDQDSRAAWNGWK